MIPQNSPGTKQLFFNNARKVSLVSFLPNSVKNEPLLKAPWPETLANTVFLNKVLTVIPLLDYWLT